MWLPYKIVVVSLHLLTLPLNLAFLFLLALYKRIILAVAKWKQDFVGPLPSANCVFIVDKIWTRPHSTIIVGLKHDGTLDHKRATAAFQRMYDERDESGQRCYREFGYYPVVFCGHGFWKKCSNFWVGDRIHDLKASEDEQELLSAFCERLGRKSFGDGQALWDVYLVRKKVSVDTLPENFAIIRFGHLMADGLSVIKVFYRVSGSDKLPDIYASNTSEEKDKESNRGIQENLKQAGFLLRHLTVGFLEYFHQLILEKDKNALLCNEKGEIKLTGNWMRRFGKQLDLEELKKVGRQNKCGVLHILLAGVSRGLERYADKYHGQGALSKGFHILAPVPVPGHPPKRLVNHWCLTKLYSQAGISKATDKFAYFKDEIRRRSKSSMPVVSAIMFKYVVGLLPTPLADLSFKAKGTFTVVFSNVVGPTGDDFRYQGSSIQDLFFWMPISQESAPLAVGIISYRGKLRVCITADKGCIPSEQRLDTLSELIYEELWSFCKQANDDMMP